MQALLTPYLTFNGNAADAMRFYQSVLGGKLTMQTFGEADVASGPEERNRIMHAALENDMLSFMASDSLPSAPVVFGDNVSMSIVGSDRSGLTELFNKLSEGGSVTMALSKQFWGDTFGMFTDKFGIHWMINISSEEKRP
jgi:PhnB protein